MFAVRGDSPAQSLRDLVGKPIAWGTRASGLTLLARYVTDGLGLDRDKDFDADLSRTGRRRPGDGGRRPGRGAVGRRHRLAGFYAVTKAGGRFIGLTADEVTRVTPSTISSSPSRSRRAPMRARRNRSHRSAPGVLSSHVRRSPDDTAYRLAKALHQGTPRWSSASLRAARPRPEHQAAAPSPDQIHPGVHAICARSGSDTAVLNLTHPHRHARQRSQACADCVNLSAMPGIHVFLRLRKQDVDGRDKPGHDDVDEFICQ